MREAEAGLTRRQFLVSAGVGAALLTTGGLAAARSDRLRRQWDELVGADGPPGAFPPRLGVTCVYDTMPSRILRRDVSYGVAWPPDQPFPGRGLPLTYVLPGRGRGPREMLEGDLRLGDFAAAPVARGEAPPFGLVAVAGGDTYWHRRASGEDAMTMLLEEFIPFCERRHGMGRRSRKAIAGWSMGGYGAIRAAELRPSEFCGLCAVSPALWRSYEDGVGDAFDSAVDYVANDVFAHVDRLPSPHPDGEGLAVRVDCGEQDPFRAATTAFIAALPFKPEGGFSPGGHDDAYWRKVAPAEIEFMWRSLFAGLGEG